jgi:hypothetical protein
MVLQRGRKSRLQRLTLALAANAPAPTFEPPQPFYRLDEPEKQIWDEIHRDYSFSYGGEMLLCMALQSLGRARHPGRRNIPKLHPLLGVERRSREFCSSVFKKLKIRLRENDCA